MLTKSVEKPTYGKNNTSKTLMCNNFVYNWIPTENKSSFDLKNTSINHFFATAPLNSICEIYYTAIKFLKLGYMDNPINVLKYIKSCYEIVETDNEMSLLRIEAH